jgi:tetratricopeptide (TPR) repeat protein
MRRLFPTLDRVIQLYPQDPGAWYQLGEARIRWGPYSGATDHETLLPFNLAVELDSAFTPAYLHLIPLSLEIEGITSGRDAMTAYLARNPPPNLAGGMALVGLLLEQARPDSATLRATLDTVSPKVLAAAARTLVRIPDTLEAALRISRERYARQEGRAKRQLTWALAYRGRLREAHALADSTDIELFAELAMLEAIAEDTVALVCRAWLAADNGSGMYHALPWWAAQQDTASISRAIESWRTQLSSGSIMPEDEPITEYAVEAAGAYLALAHGDSAIALRQFQELPVWPWGDLYRERLTLGQLLASVGRHGEAVAVLDQAPVPRTNRPRPGEIYWILQRGASHEALGDTVEALRAYRFVSNTWHHADGSLRSLVDDARRRRDRLSR